MTDGMGQGEPHVCEDRAAKQIKVRMDLQNSPLEGNKTTLFTDGCCYSCKKQQAPTNRTYGADREQGKTIMGFGDLTQEKQWDLQNSSDQS
ncbi:unnamed protein product [Coregonus sp. 'balchen']|nr:unnamed protein product [Coregonus sp. 'balchen']